MSLYHAKVNVGVDDCVKPCDLNVTMVHEMLLTVATQAINQQQNPFHMGS